MYIIGLDNSGQGKGYPNMDRSVQADFNELLILTTEIHEYLLSLRRYAITTSWSMVAVW